MGGWTGGIPSHPSQQQAGLWGGEQESRGRAAVTTSQASFWPQGLAKGNQTAFSRLQREGISSAQRNSGLEPLVYSQTRQTLEQEGVS